MAPNDPPSTEPVDVPERAFDWQRLLGTSELAEGRDDRGGRSSDAVRDQRRGLVRGGWATVGNRRKVVSVSGDGGFGQHAMELTAAARYSMEITNVLLDSDELGKISKEQRAAHFEVWQTPLQNPGLRGLRRAV